MVNKVAQRMGFWSKLKEKVSPSQLLEYFYSDIAKNMDILRENDNEIRDLAIQLKPALKNAESYFLKNEFAKAFSPLHSFYLIVSKINVISNKTIKEVNVDLNQILAQDISPEEKAILQQKQAGISEFVYRNLTDRGRALKSLMKRYPKYFGEIKQKEEKLINSGNELFDTLKATLKELASLRASRKIEAYFGVLKNLINKINNWNKSYLSFYYGTVVPFLKEVKEDKQVLLEETPASPPSVQEEVKQSPGVVKKEPVNAPEEAPIAPSETPKSNPIIDAEIIPPPPKPPAPKQLGQGKPLSVRVVEPPKSSGEPIELGDKIFNKKEEKKRKLEEEFKKFDALKDAVEKDKILEERKKREQEALLALTTGGRFKKDMEKNKELAQQELAKEKEEKAKQNFQQKKNKSKK